MLSLGQCWKFFCFLSPVGDEITDVKEIDEGWMEGRVARTGQFGMIPSNYVDKQ